MISNSCTSKTLLSFLFKNFNKIKTRKLYAVFFHYTQQSVYKAIIKETIATSIFKKNLIFINGGGVFAPFFSNSFTFFLIKFLKFTKSCKNEIYLQKIKKCFLFPCRHAVVIMQILNWINKCSLFMTVRYSLLPRVPQFKDPFPLKKIFHGQKIVQKYHC
jgi:hypothetical protein